MADMSPRTDASRPTASQRPAEHFLNRELGILAFNRRVLAQARNPRTPLLERLRFLCIVSSNLDEFFEIRVAGLKEQLKLNSVAVTTDGLSARAAYEQVSAQAHALVDAALERVRALGAVGHDRLGQHLAQQPVERHAPRPGRDAGHAVRPHESTVGQGFSAVGTGP